MFESTTPPALITNLTPGRYRSRGRARCGRDARGPSKALARSILSCPVEWAANRARANKPVFPPQSERFLEITLPRLRVSAKLSKSLKTTGDSEFKVCEEFVSELTSDL